MSSFAPNAFGAEVGLVGVKIALKWRLSRLGHARADALVDGVSVTCRQFPYQSKFQKSEVCKVS